MTAKQISPASALVAQGKHHLVRAVTAMAAARWGGMAVLVALAARNGGAPLRLAGLLAPLWLLLLAWISDRRTGRKWTATAVLGAAALGFGALACQGGTGALGWAAGASFAAFGSTALSSAWACEILTLDERPLALGGQIAGGATGALVAGGAAAIFASASLGAVAAGLGALVMLASGVLVQRSPLPRPSFCSRPFALGGYGLALRSRPVQLTALAGFLGATALGLRLGAPGGAGAGAGGWLGAAAVILVAAGLVRGLGRLVDRKRAALAGALACVAAAGGVAGLGATGSLSGSPGLAVGVAALLVGTLGATALALAPEMLRPMALGLLDAATMAGLGFGAFAAGPLGLARPTTLASGVALLGAFAVGSLAPRWDGRTVVAS